MPIEDPKLIELVLRYRKPYETDEETVYRLCRRALALQRLVDRLSAEAREKWPEVPS